MLDYDILRETIVETYYKKLVWCERQLSVLPKDNFSYCAHTKDLWLEGWIITGDLIDGDYIDLANYFVGIRKAKAIVTCTLPEPYSRNYIEFETIDEIWI